MSEFEAPPDAVPNMDLRGELEPRKAGPHGFARGMAWSFAATGGQQGIGTLVTFVLAVLLGPHSYGLVAIATIYIAFVQLALNQGFSTTIIQRQELDESHLDSAFWLNLAWAVILMAASIGLASLWADLNHSSQLTPIIDVLSILILIQALTLVQQSILIRQLSFKKLAVRSNIAAVVGGVVGIVAALEGAGVWALVAQQLTTAIVSLMLLWVVSRWVPRLRFSVRHARELMSFSVQVFAGNLAKFVDQRSDAIMMGIFFGPVAVGVYRLADRLVDTFVRLSNRPVMTFALAHFSRLQDDPEGLRHAVRSCMRLNALATVPFMLCLIAVADQVAGVLGPKWTAAPDALRLLAVVGIAKVFLDYAAALLFAIGKPHLRALFQWVLAAVSAITFALAALALKHHSTEHQVLGIAASRVVLFALIFVPLNLIIVRRLTGNGIMSLLASAREPVLAGLAAVAAVALANRLELLDESHPWARLAIASLIATATFATTLMLLDASIRERVLRFRRAPAPVGATPAPAAVRTIES
jgi:PST family polysaccharide transporter